MQRGRACHSLLPRAAAAQRLTPALAQACRCRNAQTVSPYSRPLVARGGGGGEMLDDIKGEGEEGISKHINKQLWLVCSLVSNLDNEALVLFVEGEELQQAVEGARLVARAVRVTDVAEVGQLHLVPTQHVVGQLVRLPYHMLEEEGRKRYGGDIERALTYCT